MSVRDDDLDEMARDFLAWCRDHRHLLGRDRMWPAFAAGWAYGHATGVDRAIEQMPSKEDNDK
jgi:hypothetical protein